MNSHLGKTARAASVVLGMALMHTALADPAVNCTVTVTGQNDPGVDKHAVWSAVNQTPVAGALTVCLTGIFDFGPGTTLVDAAVGINTGPDITSLRIVGLNARGGQRATIRRGIQPLTLIPTTTLANLTIENLRFEAPAFSAISIWRSIESVRLAHLQVVDPRSFGVVRSGISIISNSAPVEGDIWILDNDLDGGLFDGNSADLKVSAGVDLAGPRPALAAQPLTASVHIIGNRISNWSGSGISGVGVQNVTIEGNAIKTGPFADGSVECIRENGMGVSNGIALANARSSRIAANSITLVPTLTATGTPATCTTGIALRSNSVGETSGNVVELNRISGTGSYALLLGTPNSFDETGNLYALNPVNAFAAQGASLYIGPGANGNTLIGPFPSVEGNVAGNQVLGVH
jgi:hypothetical protein